MNWITTANRPTSKSIAADEAAANGDTLFLWECKKHGLNEHYVSSKRCRACESERNKMRNRASVGKRPVRARKRDTDKVVYKGHWPVIGGIYD